MTSKAQLAKLGKEKLQGRKNGQLLLARLKSLNKEMVGFGTFMENLPDLTDEFLLNVPYSLLDKIQALSGSLSADHNALGSLGDMKDCLDDIGDSARNLMEDIDIDEREEKRWQSKPGRRERKSRPNLGRSS